MTITRITTYDLKLHQAVNSLLPQLDDSLKELNETHFKTMLSSANTHFFVAENEENEIVGMLTIGEYDIPTAKRMWIEDVVVDQSQRGKGIGKQLLEYAIAYAREKMADSLMLTSRPQRIAANQLYQKLGFIKRETNVYAYIL